MQAYLQALGILLQPANFLIMYVCALVGCVLGAIPGLSGGLGITLLLPMTFALNTELSFVQNRLQSIITEYWRASSLTTLRWLSVKKASPVKTYFKY